MKKSRKVLTFISSSAIVALPFSFISASCNSKSKIFDNFKIEMKNPHLITQTEIIKAGIDNFVNFVDTKYKNGYSVQFLDFADNSNKTAKERKTINVKINILKDGKVVLKNVTWFEKNLKDYKENWSIDELKDLYNTIKNPSDLVSFNNKKMVATEADLIVKDAFSNKDPHIQVSAVIQERNDSTGKITYKIALANKEKPKTPKFTSTEIFEINKFYSIEDVKSNINTDSLILNNANMFLPSKYQVKINPDSNIVKQYPNLKFEVVSLNDNDRSGKKNIEVKIKSAETDKLLGSKSFELKKFMSLNRLDSLVDNITLEDLNITSNDQLLPSSYNEKIALKTESNIPQENPNVEVVVDNRTNNDNDGSMELKIKLRDVKNDVITDSYSLLRIDGFYTRVKLENLVKKITLDDINIAPNNQIFASNYNEKITLKTDSKILQENPNIELVVDNRANNDNDGLLELKIKLKDTKNATITNSHTLLNVNGFYPKSQFENLAKKMTLDDLNISANDQLLPSNYNEKITLKTDSKILTENSNIEVVVENRVNDDNNGLMDLKIRLKDIKNDAITETVASLVFNDLWSINKFNELVKNLNHDSFELIGWKKYEKYPENYKNGDLLLKNEIKEQYKIKNILLSSNLVKKDITENNLSKIEFKIKDAINNLKHTKIVDIPYFFSEAEFNYLIKKITKNNLEVEKDVNKLSKAYANKSYTDFVKLKHNDADPFAKKNIINTYTNILLKSLVVNFQGGAIPGVNGFAFIRCELHVSFLSNPTNYLSPINLIVSYNLKQINKWFNAWRLDEDSITISFA
ncbi:hypothetical protein [Mycoplasmopsis primatum]|uniref:hypothetical protein n=1 Tax=Mycoplasmopsis primatum TaxID=55604 RepID=UPI000495613B|nr:hypothetical protein [Mycoplasmopsis primatum]